MKKFFTWRDDWLLGVELMDQQHRELAVALNGMAELYLSATDLTGADRRLKQLHEQLGSLYAETRKHFQDEERLMHKAGYPDITEHAREHLMLLAELKYYIREIEEERDDVNLGVLMSLKTWFISHIIKSDREFASFLQSCPLDDRIPTRSIGHREEAGRTG